MAKYLTELVKGYAEKWSRDVYEVKQIKKLANNDNLFRYKLNNKKTYFRHEILKIRKDIDSTIPELNLESYKEKHFDQEDDGDLYIPEGYEDDYSSE